MFVRPSVVAGGGDGWRGASGGTAAAVDSVRRMIQANPTLKDPRRPASCGD